MDVELGSIYTRQRMAWIDGFWVKVEVGVARYRQDLEKYRAFLSLNSSFPLSSVYNKLHHTIQRKRDGRSALLLEPRNFCQCTLEIHTG